MLWIWITLGAAAVQTLRFMLQKKLSSSGLSVGGATFSRFLFGAPIAAAVALVFAGPVPMPSARFWAFALLGGAAQVAGTFLTVSLFKLRNFAVGIAFTKTETVQVALMLLLILGETVSGLGWLGIAVGLAGVLALSRTPSGFSARATVYGVAAGGLLGLSSICYRGATLDLMPAGYFTRAIVTLACVTAAQTVGMALYLRLREPGELGRVLHSWRRTVWVGVTGIAGSAGWFTAFALQNAAYVRALGQVEMVFTLLVSALVFHERLSRREGIGIALVVLALVLVVLGGR
ncbi:EamA family transporter [Paenirhodobacter sp.]|uniref:EamA family transporter n=1 Tax=Paenirhodobacter sp. TaxID=1965326 RepID=UPI003B50BDBD